MAQWGRVEKGICKRKQESSSGESSICSYTPRNNGGVIAFSSVQ